MHPILPPLTFAEYFAGIGLVGLGLQPHWQMLFANDISPKKKKMFVDHFGENGNYVVDDIYKLDPQRIPTTTLATASFPCIDLSVAGNQAGLTGDHSGTFWGFVRVLDAMDLRRPPLVMLENVLGWLTANGGQDFHDSIAALNQLGYACDAFVLNAHHFTPQSRPRMFIIGSQQGEALPPGQLRTLLKARPVDLRTDRLTDAIVQHEDLHWMHLPLPAPPPIQRRVADIFENLPDDHPDWWDINRVAHIYGQLSASHRARIEQLRLQEEIIYMTVYKRQRNKRTRAEVRMDGLAGCLRTPSGGSSKQIVFQIGQGTFRARWMTAREYARLQGAPEEFPINVPYLEALWGFGDAVCVPAISWISENALIPLARQVALHAIPAD